MLLTEGFKNRMLKLAGISAGEDIISEADKRGAIIKSVKLPSEISKEIADWAHNLSDKYSVWIADSFQKFLVQNGLIDKDGKSLENVDLEQGTRRDIESEIRKMAKDLNGEYLHVLDWLKGRNTLAPEHDQINFKTLTLQDALKRSDEWHEKLKQIQGGKIEGEEGEIVYTFQDGFYWIKIGKDYCPKEAEAMGHCGRASGTILYSLRRDKYPYVTAAVEEESGIVKQMKGRANTKPKAQFHKYIIPFILGNNPNVSYFRSSYAAQTDFNIADLNEVELKQVINKKPSLLKGDGEMALKKLPESEIQSLLINHSDVFYGFNHNITLSDILRNEDMVNWALKNAPDLFVNYAWGTIQLTQQQLIDVLKNSKITDKLHIDNMQFSDETLNWIVYNKPEILKESTSLIQKIDDKQKDYLVKQYPQAFKGYMNQYPITKSYDFLGPERLKVLFVKEPSLFNKLKIENYTSIYESFITSEMVENYIKNHNPGNDPLGAYTSADKMRGLRYFMTIPLGFYILKHYPEQFYMGELYVMADRDKGEVIGKYIIDHYFDWLGKIADKHYFFGIERWDLSSAQKQKIVDSDAQGETTLLINYSSEDIKKLNLSKEQIQELLNSEEFMQYMTIDLLQAFNLPPENEQTKEIIFKLIEEDEDESIKIINEVTELYGEEYVHSLYNLNSSAFISLIYPVKYKDVERLKKFNNPSVSYEQNGIKIRFDDWSDEELIDFFEDSEKAKQIANFDLDLWGNYNYSFNDIDSNFDDLDRLNIARVRFLLIKAFPLEYKEKIKNMKISELVEILNEPESIDENGDIQYEESIIESIKDVFVNATEEAQLGADESEYWKLYVGPIEKLFGNSKFVDIKTKKKSEEEIKTVQMLEFEISYKEFENYLDIAQKNASYNFGSEVIDTNEYAGEVIKIIKSALEEEGDKLTVDEPYYGVNGYIKKSDLNDIFVEKLFGENELSSLLQKTKVVVKNKQ